VLELLQHVSLLIRGFYEKLGHLGAVLGRAPRSVYHSSNRELPPNLLFYQPFTMTLVM
jgi:hypothetical protein